MNASITTVTSPSSGGTVSSYFDSAAWIYGASASANTGYEVTDWTLYCKYCHHVIANFGAVSNIGFNLHNYPGHPGPFVVTCIFNGGYAPPDPMPFVKRIIVTIYHHSIEDKHAVTRVEEFTVQVTGSSSVSIALTAPESVVEDWGGSSSTWRFLNFGINRYDGTRACSIVSREGLNTNNATIVVAPGRSNLGYGELKVTAFYYRTPYLLLPGSGYAPVDDEEHVYDNRLVIHQPGVLVYGTDFRHGVVDTHGDRVPF